MDEMSERQMPMTDCELEWKKTQLVLVGLGIEMGLEG